MNCFSIFHEKLHTELKSGIFSKYCSIFFKPRNHSLSYMPLTSFHRKQHKRMGCTTLNLCINWFRNPVFRNHKIWKKLVTQIQKKVRLWDMGPRLCYITIKNYVKYLLFHLSHKCKCHFSREFCYLVYFFTFTIFFIVWRPGTWTVVGIENIFNIYLLTE